MNRVSIALALLLALSGCQPISRSAVGVVNLSDKISSTPQQNIYSYDIKRAKNAFDGMYKPLGRFETDGELLSTFNNYTEEIKEMFYAGQLLTVVEQSQVNQGVVSLNAFDNLGKYSYSLSCNEDGFQILKMTALVTARNSNEYNFEEELHNLVKYTGVRVSTYEMDALLQDINNSNEEIFSSVIKAKNGEASFEVKCNPNNVYELNITRIISSNSDNDYYNREDKPSIKARELTEEDFI